MKASNRHISNLIRKYVSEIDPEAEVILYGSRARGDDRKDSDWDILILTPYPVDPETERQFIHKLYDLELNTGESFSVFVYSKKEWNEKHRISPFYHNVRKEGIRL